VSERMWPTLGIKLGQSSKQKTDVSFIIASKSYVYKIRYI